MGQSSNPEQGPSFAADNATVEQETGAASGLEGAGQSHGDSDAGPVGVTAAVERGPAELSDQGEPVRENPHASLESREPARSTDEL